MSGPPTTTQPAASNAAGILTEHDGQELCRIVVTTLREYAFSGSLPPGAPHRKSLLVPSCAAVHLYEGDQLRGRCVLLDEDNQLYYAVELAAVQAGFFDARGDRIKQEEISRLRVVVTVLGAAESLPGEDDPMEHIDPERVAVVVRLGPCQGSFTPECVRAEKWDRAAYREAIYRSVGLAADAPADKRAAVRWQRRLAQSFYGGKLPT